MFLVRFLDIHNVQEEMLVWDMKDKTLWVCKTDFCWRLKEQVKYNIYKK